MAGFVFSNLRARIVALVALAVVPALLFALHTGLEERRAAGDRVRESTQLLTRLASGNHDRLIGLTRQFLATLAEVPEFRELEGGRCSAFAARLLDQQPAYADFGVIGPSGQIACSAFPPAGARDKSGALHFRKVIETRAFAAGDVEHSGIPARPALHFGYPIVGEANTLRGVAFAALDLGWLQAFAESAEIPPGATVFLVDGKGKLLAHHPNPADWVGRTLGRVPVAHKIAEGAKGVVESEGPDGVRRLHAFTPLETGGEGTALIMGVGLPPDQAYAEADKSLVRTLAGLGLVGLLSLFAAWAFGDAFIVRRVQALMAAASGLAAGDLRARTGLQHEPGTLGQLAREFDQMAAVLEVRQEEAEKKAQELRESERRKSAILDGAADCVITMDHQGRVLEWNPAAQHTFGYAPEQALGRDVEELLVPPRLRDHDVAGLKRYVCMEEGALRTRVERTAMRADGSEFTIEACVTAIETEKGPPLFTAFMRDISERKQAEEDLRAARDDLQKRVEDRTAELKAANDRLVDWVEELQQRAQDMRVLSEVGDHLQACHTVEEAYTAFAQYARNLFPDEPGALCMLNEELTLMETVAAWGETPPAEEVFAPEDCWALRRSRPHQVDGPGAHLVCRHVGTPPPAAYVCVPMMAQGKALGILHLVESVRHPGSTEEVVPHHVLARRQLAFTVADQVALSLSNLRLQEKLRDQAIRDPLTGLFNRRYMEESLGREMRRAERRQVALGVIMLDIDHFKRFNDTYGHAGGDALLREVGGLLQAHTRGEDIACRYGGEEFTLILLEASKEDTEERAEAIRVEASRMHVEHAGQPLGSVTLSLGVAVFPEHGADGKALLAAADAALYRAKAGGRDRVMVATAPAPAVMASPRGASS